jgi:Transmembrane secretion effector
MLVSIAIGFCLGGLVEVALPILVNGAMHGGASGYGVILAAWGAGALGGGILAGTPGRRKHKGLIMLLATLLIRSASTKIC